MKSRAEIFSNFLMRDSVQDLFGKGSKFNRISGYVDNSVIATTEGRDS